MIRTVIHTFRRFVSNPIASDKSRRRRLQALSLILCLLPASYAAQEVPVPTLVSPAYQSTDFDPVFATAEGSPTQAGWETLVDQARILLGAQWEATVDATIDAHVASVGHTDYFHTVQEYRDYLQKELLLS